VTTARRTQAERRAASEQRLLDAAARVIADRGSSGATFSEIADAAGCSRSLPHYLFGTKTAMLRALAEHTTAGFLDNLLAPRLEGRTGLDAVVAVLEVFLESLRRPWPHTRAIYVLVADSFGAAPELRDVLNDHHRAMRGHLAALLGAGVADGTIRADVDVDAHAALLVATMRGAGLLVLGDPDRVDLEALTAEIVESARRALTLVT
jgi:AcrR family transcriptional regulator